MDGAAREQLFQELKRLSIPTEDKPSLAENLKDALEILAVAEGSKPAHLNGHGFRSAWLQDQLDLVAAKYSLSTIRTRKIRRFEYQQPKFWPELVQWQRDQDAARRAKEANVIWVYREPRMAQVIADTVEGHVSCSHALGYPECCVRADFERGEYIFAGLVNGLQRKFKADTAERIIALLARDEAVSFDTEWIHRQMEQSHARFPYVQFFACPACLMDENSPAARVNRAMRDLAFSVAPTFGADIWRAVRAESAGQHGSVTRNEPCPCGSTRKFKKCCGLIRG